jgi:Domain of unknown function (DUF4440)
MRQLIISYMKQVLFLVLLFVFVNAGAQTEEEKKLTTTIKEFHQALVKKNTVSINQQTDKSLSYGHSNGWIENKTELIQHLETGVMKYNSYREDSLVISINGNMANARFIADISGALNGVSNKLHLKVLEVWVKKGNRWILFARQAVR